MQIKNKHVSNTYKILFDLELEGKTSRLRSRFNRILQEHYNNIIQPEENELKNQYAIKDENNEIIIDEKGNFRVTAEYLNEMDILLDEYLHIDLNESNKEMLLMIAHLFLDEELITVSGELAETYDIVCSQFEHVYNFYKLNNEKIN
ncbi:hypothetical protein [Lysinibacillus pakistanensis]|uniref:DUF1617 family protein n=1 Tax=Lysinibacillus pakistanensis TaxID=759811 RepID=A0AAX3WZ25_9BACI|nr:hypothetical protein [Lysinibacillus pakistanensis]MDM5232588.1 hypothetical protein [Lysinibacillus pakistanensis]WHY48094.1 hypothetical protein QNH22_07660 [Lysinibacillus pakistanensis]WHY53106.1 hypothetical protein QNH24_07645 [Lysinibacillus pakistanensis]